MVPIKKIPKRPNRESVHNILNALYEKSIGRHFSARFSGFADHDSTGGGRSG